jgi:hypothetical protein
MQGQVFNSILLEFNVSTGSITVLSMSYRIQGLHTLTYKTGQVLHSFYVQ